MLRVTGAADLSWPGILFLTTLDNYIPNSFSNTKVVIKVSKFVLGILIIFVEHTSTAIIGFG